MKIKYKTLKKEYLASLVRKSILHLTQNEAAKVLGINQPLVSRIVLGKLEHISTTKLMSLAECVGFEITLTIERKKVKKL